MAGRIKGIQTRCQRSGVGGRDRIHLISWERALRSLDLEAWARALASWTRSYALREQQDNSHQRASTMMCPTRHQGNLTTARREPLHFRTKRNDDGKPTERIRRLMHGSKKTEQQRHSRLVDEFDKFVAVAGESLSSMYERLTTLVAKKEARNHDPLALVAHSNVHSSHSHAREIQGDAQKDKLTTAMMLLARAITQHYSTPNSNHLHTSSNTRNQAVIQDGRVDIQSKNVGYTGNGNRNAGRSNRNQIATTGNGMVQQIEANDHIIQRVPQTESNPRKEQMLLAMKDKSGGNLNEEENDFMLDNHYGNDSLEELNAALIMMTRIQPTDDKDDC
ncbi:hypothetical protein Tco_0835732 [Tanacetum coccineum]